VIVVSIKIATWNINSVRLRRNLAARFLRTHQPDVLCLQETKCPDELFPADTFKSLGYVHQAINGQKGYHGVAIVSRLPFKRTEKFILCDKNDCRHVTAQFEAGLELHSFYVPAGGDVPDAAANPKFAHKLAFLRELADRFEKAREGRHGAVALVGDLNVAPLENDVWSHKQLLKVVSHTPIEVELLKAARQAFEWQDVTRSFVPHEQKIYSWWSYRNQDWRASDRGRRLDHIWVSPGLKGAVSGHAIMKDMRDWKLASDHVPVMATIAL
jgi:exodeoxyribonuclease-3